MRIKKWLGWISNASPYALPAGANVEQCNIQCVTPGQLTPRRGIWPVSDSLLATNFSVGQNSQILTLYRRAKAKGTNDVLLGYLQSSQRIRNLTSNADLLATADVHKDVVVLTATGTSPGAGTTITVDSATGITTAMFITGINIPNNTIVSNISGNVLTLSQATTGAVSGTVSFSLGGQRLFTTLAPVNICEDRYGNVYFFQGFGYRPLRWSGTADTDRITAMGIESPTTAPTLARAAGADGYYIERVDVIDGGGAYWAAPEVTITGTLNTNGTAARLRAVVEAGEVTAVEVVEPGHNYSGPVTLAFATDTAAANTFAAVANLATTSTTATLGITISSPTATTGSLTAGHTLAVAKNNATVTAFQGASTTSTSSYAASLQNGVWITTGLPLYRTSNNSDSGARISASFSNIAYTYTDSSQQQYSLDAYVSRTDSANASKAGYALCEPPQFSGGYPKVTVPGSGKYYDMRYDGSLPAFFADVTVPSGTGVVRVYFDANPSSFTFSNFRHPDFPLPTFALPNRWYSKAPTVQSVGTGYTVANTTLQINEYTANTDDLTGSAASATFSTKTVGSAPTVTLNMPGSLVSVTAVTAPGSSWGAGDTGYIQLASRPQADNSVAAPASYTNAQKITMTPVTTTPSVTAITGQVGSVTVTNGGSNLLVAPEIFYTGGGGYGLLLQATVSNGSIPTGTAGVTVIDGGAGFTQPPSLFIKTGGATAVAVMRPTMTGKYQCAYRWVDARVTTDQGGPVYSSFSPISDYNAGPALSYRSTNTLNWTITVESKPARATGIELWRTSSEQSLVFYRALYQPLGATTFPATFAESFSDEQLFDPNRGQYAALPVVLPNGNLNAYRFGVPRSDMAVGVAFQDRLWYGVSTSGEKPNSLFYSEYDEFESCPDTNELTIQQNIRSSDILTALVPFGGQLLAMQQLHCYSLTYITDPAVDANVQLVAYRGCLNQRCWEIFEGKLYVADLRGIYAITPSGQIEDLSQPIEDIFELKLNRPAATDNATTASDRFLHLKIDPITRILRFFCTLQPFAAEASHMTALCYHLDSKTWWTERYPTPIRCSANLKDETGRIASVYGAGSPGRVMRIDNGYNDWASNTVVSVSVTNPGTGYTSTPTVTAAGGTHGIFEAVLDGRGGIRAVIVRFGGRGYTNGGAITVTGGGGSGCTGTVQSVSTAVSNGIVSNATSIPWWFKTGNMEFVTDRESNRNGGEQSRAIALTYKPTESDRTAHLRVYYNNSPVPRPNFALRDRETGFVHDVTGSSSTLNTSASRSSLGPASGVSIARFAGRGADDAVGNDRHVAVEISSDPPTVRTDSEANTTVVFEIDAQGVIDG